jgi:hypothetical protein
VSLCVQQAGGVLADVLTWLRPAGWILFLVFAGWGIFAAPIDWIFQYIRRPKAVITKSEYIERARGLAMRAKDIKVG